MKKFVFFLIIISSTNISFSQDLNLDFTSTNFISSSSDTFKCVGDHTHCDIILSFPEDTNYTVLLIKNNLDTNFYNILDVSIPFNIPFIYAGSYKLLFIPLNENLTTFDTLFSFYDPTPLNFFYEVYHPQSCNELGAIDITIVGGSEPYNLGYGSQDNFEPIFFQNLEKNNFLIENINSGLYSISLTDSYNCFFNIGDDNNPIEINQVPDPINIQSISIEDSVRICVQGGNIPFHFVLDSDTSSINDSCITYSLCAGNYNLIVFDEIGEISCSDSINFNIEDIQGFISQETSTMKVQSGGVQPFSYSWTINGDIQGNQTDSIYAGGLCPGSYTCTIIDQAYCSSTFDLTINEIESNLIEEIDCFDQDFSTLETSVSGGTSPYEYLWNTNETTSSISSLSPQTYQLTITDNNDCQLIEEIEVPVVLDSCLFNAFSPNGDNINDIWVVNPSFLYEDTEVIIYNRWGVKVYQSLGYKQAWDGKNSSGILVKEGVYFYSIILKNGHEKIKGSVSVFY